MRPTFPTDALAVTAINIERHAVQARVRAMRSDVFDALAGERYDVIVSNPPYVGDAEMAELPEEYRREPATGLHGGRDGLDIVRRILARRRRAPGAARRADRRSRQLRGRRWSRPSRRCRSRGWSSSAAAAACSADRSN